MRIRDFILPLMEDLTAQKAKRAEFIKSTLGARWSGLPEYPDLEKFIEKISEVDPTNNGSFMPWIAKLVITKPDENKVEDLDRLGQDLRNWVKFKDKMTVKDINQYKSFQDVYLAVAPFLQKRKKTAAEKAKDRKEATRKRLENEMTIVHQGPEGWVRIPLTKAAACFLGQSTRWCTAARKSNLFSNYNDTDRLFVIYDRASKQRYQLHIQSGQFADEADTNFGIEKTPKWAREHIVNWYIKNNPQLKLAQMMTLVNFSPKARELLDKQDMGDLGDLISRYGVK